MVYYDQWLTPTTEQIGGEDLSNWVVTCATNNGARVYVNGVNVATSDHGGGSMDPGLYINEGYHASVSDWAVAEVITWKRSLTDSEMAEASSYLYNDLLGRN